METNLKTAALPGLLGPGVHAIGGGRPAGERPLSMLPPPPVRASCGELQIDREEGRAALAGNALSLTAREYALLLYLMDRANRAVRRSELLAHVWEQSYDGSNVIDVYIGRLRHKFGDHAGMIQTVRGFGYRLRPPQAA